MRRFIILAVLCVLCAFAVSGCSSCSGGRCAGTTPGGEVIFSK